MVKSLNMKTLAAIILLLSATIVFSGPIGLFTQKAQDWQFIQSVGGMKVSVEDHSLNIECDVSGVKQVTVRPSMINSALGVRKVKHTRDGDTIYLTIVTSVIEKGISTSPKPVDLSDYPMGEYSVQYLDPDGAKHAVGKITVKRKKNAGQGAATE